MVFALSLWESQRSWNLRLSSNQSPPSLTHFRLTFLSFGSTSIQHTPQMLLIFFNSAEKKNTQAYCVTGTEVNIGNTYGRTDRLLV